MERILCVLIGYICGLFQTSYLYGKVHGIDIRNYGSGNAGTTNALRTLGAKAGAITLLGDCFKCVVAVVIVHLIFGKSHPEMIRLLGDSGALYENEKRVAVGLPPLAELEGVRMQSLNYANVDMASTYQLGKIAQPSNDENGGGQDEG